MIIALPFHSRDSQTALDLLDWLSPLCGHIPAQIVLVHEQSVDATAHNLAASKVFQSVRHLNVTTLADKWPHAPNCYFAQTANAMQSQSEPWWWFEPDALPLSPYFYSEAKAAYHASGKPCMGSFFPTWFQTSEGPKQSGVHLTGSAIYPANLFKSSGLCKFLMAAVRDDMAARRIPRAFDVYLQGELVSKSHETKLIQDTWRSENYRVTKHGIEFDVVDPEKKGLAKFLGVETVIRPEALVVHGCKDGSLLRLARKLHAQGKFAETVAFAQKAPGIASEAKKAQTAHSAPQNTTAVKFEPFIQPKVQREQVDPWGAGADLPPDPRGSPDPRVALPAQTPENQPPNLSDATQARETFKRMPHNPGCLSRVPCLNYLNETPFLICDCGARVQLPAGIDWKTAWKGSATGEVTFSEPTERGGDDLRAPQKQNEKLTLTANSEKPSGESAQPTAVLPTSTNILPPSNGAAESNPQRAPKTTKAAKNTTIFNSEPERNQKVLSQQAIARKGELLDIGSGKRGAFSVLRELGRKAGVKNALQLKKVPLVDAILEAELGEKMYEAI